MGQPERSGDRRSQRCVRAVTFAGGGGAEPGGGASFSASVANAHTQDISCTGSAVTRLLPLSLRVPPAPAPRPLRPLVFGSGAASPQRIAAPPGFRKPPVNGQPPSGIGFPTVQRRQCSTIRERAPKVIVGRLAEVKPLRRASPAEINRKDSASSVGCGLFGLMSGAFGLAFADVHSAG